MYETNENKHTSVLNDDKNRNKQKMNILGYPCMIIPQKQ